MAFNRNLAAVGGPIQGQDDSWKAQAFINMYLPTKDGGRRKIGSIPLKESKPRDNDLIKLLSGKDGEANLAKVLEKLELDFRLADGSDDSGGFDL